MARRAEGEQVDKGKRHGKREREHGAEPVARDQAQLPHHLPALQNIHRLAKMVRSESSDRLSRVTRVHAPRQTAGKTLVW